MAAEPKATLEHILQSLGFSATIEEHRMEDGLLLDVKTEDSGRLIGRQGQTLSDLQYITNRLLFQQDPSAPKVMVDVSGYRAQARDALVKKAREAAEKVRRWGDVVELEPLIDKVWRYCEDAGNRGRTVTLKMKFNDFEIITRSKSVPVAISNRSELESLAVALLQNEMPVPKPVRLLGVSLSALQDADDAEPQLALPM